MLNRIAKMSAGARLAVGLVLVCILGTGGMAVSVVAVGLALALPARTVIGSAPEMPGLQAVEIASRSGSLLHGWLVPGRPGGGAVLLMHGVRSNRQSMIRAELLNAHGFAVLLFDFQAHGESPGNRITFGHLEAMDAAVLGRRVGLQIDVAGALHRPE